MLLRHQAVLAALNPRTAEALRPPGRGRAQTGFEAERNGEAAAQAARERSETGQETMAARRAGASNLAASWVHIWAFGASAHEVG